MYTIHTLSFGDSGSTRKGAGPVNLKTLSFVVFHFNNLSFYILPTIFTVLWEGWLVIVEEYINHNHNKIMVYLTMYMYMYRYTIM